MTQGISSDIAAGEGSLGALGTYAITDEEFNIFRALILKEAGISLTGAKRQLVTSRLAKRLRYFGFTTFAQYHHYLKTQDPGGEERREMINCLTTNKTDFFRENHHFAFLREQLLPEVRERALHGAPRRLRIWSAACSSGEEPYSIAATVREAWNPLLGWDVKILASDIDTDMLRKGEEGIYPLERFAGVPDAIKHRYFLRGKGEWGTSLRARPELRDLIVFRRINLIEDPWPIRTRFDAIFCRNVIIYFNRATQQRLFARLANYLKEDGYLFVGHSESLHWLSDVFVPLRGTIYRLRK
jgi:chemotaxis protein methyltransferase CheR